MNYVTDHGADAKGLMQMKSDKYVVVDIRAAEKRYDFKGTYCFT